MPELPGDDYNWEEAFAVAARDGVQWAPVGSQPGLPPRFTLGNVAHVEGAVAGDNDGPNWIVYGILDTGYWFYLEAGCDYTGWG